jgi:hypothetical protein
VDPSKLIRDPAKVHAALREMNDGRVIALAECKIYIPVRYAEHNLAYVGARNYILGIYAITVEDKFYGVSLLNTMIPIEPTSVSKVKIDEDNYYEFFFRKGATVFKTVNLVKTDTLVYRIYDEFIAKGYVPWFMGYEEIGKIFDTAKEFADANIGQNPEVTQLIASIVARDPRDRTKYYRTAISDSTDLNKIKPVFVPLKSVQYSATNTLTKLGGSYFQQGVVSALISPSTRIERTEAILRR